MRDFDVIVLQALRFGGPYRASELNKELARRAEIGLLDLFDGFLGAAAVNDSLDRLAGLGLAEKIAGKWDATVQRRKPTYTRKELIV